jgi:C-terminal processing protease CtpA/Prc
MIEQNDYSYTSLQNFGFRTSVIDNKNIVSILYKNSNAEQNGILLGDEVLEINDINIRYLIAEDACNFLFNNPLKDLKSMNLLILRGEERHSIVLETETFIE